MKRRELLWLGVIVVCAVAIRLAYLHSEMVAPGFQWDDPDGYLRQAYALTKSGSWKWTRLAVEYIWGGKTWKLPPGYPVFLSIFYGNSGQATDPTAAAIAQCVIGGLSSALVFAIARYLHSTRAGFVAAVVWALWFPAISSSRIFVQEQFYLPMLCASFAALAWALSKPAGTVGFFLAGTIFALTALTRAMPLFCLPLLLAVIWWSERRRQRGVPSAIAFAAGVMLFVVPYVVWLSATTGRLVIIDDHMMILQSNTQDPRSLATTLALLKSSLTGHYEAHLQLALGMLKVYGPSWLYHYGSALNERTAWALGFLVHFGLDTLFVLVVLGAPVGFVLARQRPVAAALFIWTLFVIGVSVLLGFAGPRYRAPIEPMLVAAAAVVAAGRYNWPARWLGAVAGAASLALAVYVLPQYVDSWRASVPYGLNGWTRLAGSVQQTFARGPAGFYVPAVGGLVTIDVEPFPESPPVEFAVNLEKVHVASAHAVPGEATTVRLPVGARGIGFVELVPRDASPPTAYYIRILR